jgi:hypothetical protein
MASFPALKPGIRTFTPGGYPHSTFAGMSGAANRVRNSNVMLESQLRLTFVAITESQMLSILAHYQGQRGNYESFLLPGDVWSGGTAADFQLSGYGWIYREPPTVEDLPCGGHNVELILETVPPEGTALLGANMIVRYSIVGGRAAAANGAALTIGYSISGGRAGLPGLAQTVTYSITGGDATSGGFATGLNLNVSYFIQQQPNGFAAGLAKTITYSLDGGAASGAATDPSFSSVSLLLHMNGSNNSTTFTDNSSNAFTVTVNGSPVISTAQSKFGGASGLFDGSANSRLTVPSSSAFDLSSGDFTIELWIYISTIKDCGLVAKSTNNWALRLRSNGGLAWNANGSQLITGSATLSSGTWNHVAVVKSGSTTTLYANGAADGTTTSSPVNTTSVVTIGNNPSALTTQAFNGHIDDLRITKGVARYTANFTPPIEAFPDS